MFQWPYKEVQLNSYAIMIKFSKYRGQKHVKSNTAVGHFRDDNIWLQLPKPEFSLLLLSYLNFSVILFTFVFVLLFFFSMK